MDDATRVVAQTTASHRADKGMAWGTLIHGLLEHAMRHRDATREDLRRLALWLTVEESQLRPYIDQAIQTTEDVSRHEMWATARGTTHCVETPFTIQFDSALTTGVIDLMFDPGNGWRIVDYKTDRLLDARRYSTQLDAYRGALERCGCQVASAQLLNV